MARKHSLEQLDNLEEQIQKQLDTATARLKRVQSERRRVLNATERRRAQVIGALAFETGIAATNLGTLKDVFLAVKRLIEDPDALKAFMHPPKPSAARSKLAIPEKDASSLSPPLDSAPALQGA